MSGEKRPKLRQSRPKTDSGTGPHHIGDEPVADADSPHAMVQSPIKDARLSIEEQIHNGSKKPGGLPTSLTGRPR
jgi:hypothetical protein